MDKVTNIQRFEGVGDIDAEFPCSQWNPSGKQKVETAFTNVTHVAQSDAFVAINRCRFPTIRFRKASEHR